MNVKISQASIDERGKTTSGQAGNQSGRELNTANWHTGFTMVYRPVSTTAAERIASTAEAAVANRNIGYDQSQRLTLAQAARKVNWDVARITTPCETDCSALVAVCINAAGIPVVTTMYTGNMDKLLMATGQFTKHSGRGYTTSSENLRRGDILWKNGHTAIVTTGAVPLTGTGSAAPASSAVKIDKARIFASILAGTYIVTASELHIRSGAGTAKTSLGILPRGTKVICHGYCTVWNDVRWLLVEAGDLTGFVSSKFIEKA